MKRILFICLLFAGFLSKAQDYYLDTYNSQTVTACRGNVLPSWNCAAYGYAGYCNNENYTVTFYSGNPLVPLKLSFLPLYIAGFPTGTSTVAFYTENTFDYLRIYDGPNVASTQLAALTGTINAPFSITSTGPYLTVRFTSDGTVNDWGWYALLGCQPQGCSGNLPANDVCAGSPPICDLNGYCGTTNGWYTPDNFTTMGANYGGGFCGSIENNSWIKFIPNAATANVNVVSTNCAYSGSGLQASLVQSSNCNTFAVLACQSQSTGPGTMNLTYNAFVPGQVYYVMIDGYAGNACDYTVTASTGVAVSTINASSSAICQGQSVNLTAVAAGSSPSYTWNTGSNSANISVSPNLTTVYSATVASGFCTEVITRTITVNNLPTANAGTSPGSITCSNPTRTLTGSGGGNYSWSGAGIVSGNLTANPVVNGPGPFNLVVTSPAGCTSTNVAQVSIPVNTTVPGPASITSPTVLNCSNPSMVLSGSPNSGVTYTWTGQPVVSGGNSANPTVNAGGTYIMNITSSVNGCTNTANINIAAPNTTLGASASTGNTITCVNNTISLNASPSGMSYTWTAPGGSSILTGVNNAAATALNAGTYSLNVFNSTNGCSQLTTIAANINLTAPTGTASSTGVVTCTNNAINLSVNPSGNNYNWTASSGGTITSGATSQNATATGNATYSVLITNPTNGCTVTRTVVPTTNTTIITPSTIPTPAALNCTLTSTNLTGNPVSGVTYSWTGPSSFASNLANPSVSSPGFYTLVVTNTSNGCQNTNGSAVVLVNQSLTQPTLSAASQTANASCTSPVPISGSANPNNSSVTWLGGVVSGVNSYTATAFAGVYTLQAAHPSTGCTANLTFTVFSTSSPQNSLSASSGTITCTNTLVTAIGSSTTTPVSYAWSGPGIVGPSNTPTLSANASGNYTLTVTNTNNNCVNSQVFNVLANNSPVTAVTNVTNNTITCNNPSSTISGTASVNGSYTYNWSGPSSFTSSSQTFSTGLSGAYVVTVTNVSNGCKGTATVSINSNTTIPTGLAVGANSVNIPTCISPTAVISATASGATSYSWIAPPSGSVLSNGTTTALVSGTGNYSVIAIGSNGCSTPLSSAAIVTVSPNAGSPAYTISSNSVALTCNNPTAQVVITSTATSLVWQQTVGVSGTYTANFNQAGNYSAVLTNTATSCSSQINVVVANNSAAPSASLSSIPVINCTNTLVSINPIYSPTTNIIYSWSGSGIVGSTTNSAVQSSTNSPLVVTFTNTSNGCVGTLTTSPGLNTTAPTITLNTNTGSTNLTCASPTLNFTSNSTPATGLTYSWSNGATSPNVSLTQAGAYSVVVTNTANGCSTMQSFTVGGNTNAPTFSTNTNASMSCGSTTAGLQATSSNTNVTYFWSGGAILSNSASANVVVGAAAIYTLLVTDNVTGCTTTQTVSVTNNNVNAQFTANTLLGPPPLEVNFNNTSTGATTYNWSFGNNQGTSTTINPSNTFNEPGTYIVMLTATSASCTSTATLEIVVQAALGEIPEVFTPNGDLFNPTFEIKGLDSYPNNSLEIFNRWGNPVYSAKPYKNDWDGRANKSSIGTDKLPTGTYFYILDLGDGKTKPIKGYIQLQY